MTIFYFTATGNSLAVAKHIGGELVPIPQVVDSENQKYEDDVIGVVFPIYALTAPKMVRRFLNKAKLKAEYTFAIGTYGNMPGAAMRAVQKSALQNGYSFNYTDSILMVDNYLPNFEIGKQIAKLPEKKSDEKIAQVKKSIENRKQRQAPASLAWRALSALISGISYDKAAQRYIVNSRCNKCGICANVCPAKNIAVTDKVNFNDHCEGCLACAHLCPQNAIHLKNERSDKRWRNPDVSLKEIMNANSRLTD